MQESRLETLVFQKYDIISEEGGYLYPHLVATGTHALQTRYTYTIEGLFSSGCCLT